jgi:hypothetical protein
MMTGGYEVIPGARVPSCLHGNARHRVTNPRRNPLATHGRTIHSGQHRVSARRKIQSRKSGSKPPRQGCEKSEKSEKSPDFFQRRPPKSNRTAEISVIEAFGALILVQRQASASTSRACAWSSAENRCLAVRKVCSTRIAERAVEDESKISMTVNGFTLDFRASA